MIRRSLAATLFAFAAIALVPGHASATGESSILDGTEGLIVRNIDLGNLGYMYAFGSSQRLGTQFDFLTGRITPVSFMSQRGYLDSDGNGESVATTTMGNRTGISAGDGWPAISVWTDVSHNWFNDDHPSVDIDSETGSYFFGADVEAIDNLILGVSVGFDDTKSESDLPLGGALGSSRAKDHTDTITVAPYIVYVINAIFDVDASFGFSWSDTDSQRSNGAVTVTSNSDGNAWFFAVNGNATYWFDYIGVTGSVGYRRSNATTDGFTDSTGAAIASASATTGTLVTKARVSYYYPTGNEILQAVMPFFSATLEYDHTKDMVDVGPTQASPADDRVGMVLTGGVNFSLTDSISAGIQGSTIVFRTDQSSYTASGNLRFSF